MKKILFISVITLLLGTATFASKANSIWGVLLFSDSVKTLSAPLIDTLKNASRDSLKTFSKKNINPINEPGLLDTNYSENILPKAVLNKTDYRYTGNFISHTHFGFVRDFGSIGQPNEILIYGQGFNNSTFLSDGINITNRLTNSFDLNLFQSESIDKIEIIPLVRGFLFGSSNNPVAVNFVSSNIHEDKPYTRIKFYQGIYQEGFFDGIFNSSFGNKLGVFVELTNQSTDPRYTNSDHSAWLGSTHLRYSFSDKINLITGYSFTVTNTQLNGGVDIDSIKNNYAVNHVDEILYSNLQAPVNYKNRFQKQSIHNSYIKVLADLISNSPTSLTVYYQNSLNEYRQNDSTNRSNLQNGIVSILNNNRYKTSGISLDQSFKYNFINLRAITGFEQNDYDSPIISIRRNRNYWVSAFANLELFERKLIPSIFVKHLNKDDNGFRGAGFDISLFLSRNLKLYAGLSSAQKPNNIFQIDSFHEKTKTNIFEATVTFKNEMLKLESGFFSISKYNAEDPVVVKGVNGNNLFESARFFENEDRFLKGANLSFELKFWNIFISANTSFYFSEEDRKKTGIPKFTSNGGIYYVDTLFNNNLKLKSGLNYWSVGSRGATYFDFQRNISSPYLSDIMPLFKSLSSMPDDIYSTDFQIDFFLAAQIQENATVYFSFENLLNREYSIVPYYPMYERGMRLGIAWEFFN